MQQVYRTCSFSSIDSQEEVQNLYLLSIQQQFQNNSNQNSTDKNEAIINKLLTESEAKELEEIIEDQNSKFTHQEIVDYDSYLEQLQENFHLNVLPGQNQIQIQEYTQILPVVLQIQLIQSQLKTQRANIDLICVVDVSGSMKGKKINLVQNTLRYIQKILKPNDRIALVTFATQASINLQWTRNLDVNKSTIKEAIKNIKIRDTTNIASGVALGLRMIRDRKYKNPVTCMFVLSDGADNDIDADLRCQSTLQEYNLQDTFTINTFGYGSNHNAKVMNNIANLRGGQYVYIDHIEKVSQHFILVMSGMLSVKVQNVILTVKQLNNKFKIAKIFGDDFLWSKLNETDFQLNINYLAEREKKEYALEIEIPYFKQQEVIQENILQIDLQGVFLGSQTNFKKTSFLQVGFTKNHIINEPVELVEINYLRTKAGDRIGQAKELANNKKYDQAIQLLNKMIDEIESSLFKDNKQLVVVLRDLNEIKRICKPQTYEINGEAMMLYKQKNHIQRQRSINNSDDWCEDEENQMNQYRNGDLNLSASEGSCKSIGIVKNVNHSLGSIPKQFENEEQEIEKDISSSPKNIQRSRSSSGSCDTCRQKKSRSSSLS